MENLISMTDFVLEQERDFNEGITGWKEYTNSTINYAKFLKRPLELWMFVPCDTQGNVLKIIPFKEHKQGSNFEFLQHHYYDIAKEICFFEGFYDCKLMGNCISITKNDINLNIVKGTIECLIDNFENIKLTESAKKMFF
jgi:hypothetical protein